MPPREDYATAFSSKPNSVCIAPGGAGVFRSMLFEALSFSASLTKFRRRGFAPSCAGLACMHISGCPAIMRRDTHYEKTGLVTVGEAKTSKVHPAKDKEQFATKRTPPCPLTQQIAGRHECHGIRGRQSGRPDKMSPSPVAALGSNLAFNTV